MAKSSQQKLSRQKELLETLVKAYQKGKLTPEQYDQEVDRIMGLPPVEPEQNRRP